MESVTQTDTRATYTTHELTQPEGRETVTQHREQRTTTATTAYTVRGFFFCGDFWTSQTHSDADTRSPCWLEKSARCKGRRQLSRSLAPAHSTNRTHRLLSGQFSDWCFCAATLVCLLWCCIYVPVGKLTFYNWPINAIIIVLLWLYNTLN